MKVAVINPLESATPTGMGVAGTAVRLIVKDLGLDATPEWVPRLFRFINDRVPGGLPRMLLRLLAVQVVPLALGRKAFLIFTAHQAPLWRTRRHAVIVHDLISIAYPFQHRSQSQFFIALLPRVVACAEKLVTISQATRKVLMEQLAGGRTREAAVIPSWSEHLAGVRGSVSARQTRRFLVVGAKYRHKNLDLVLAAFERLRSRGVGDFVLVVLGCNQDLWRVDEGGLAPLVRAGWLSCVSYAENGRLREEYERCAALIYPSLVEGLGLPPLEALSAGCPVICADIPALRETCGDAAWYVDPHDPEPLAALLERWLAGDFAEALASRQARVPEVLSRFSRETIATQWRIFFQACALP
jgi:glycosyltransferase involved in cell wall biosynthesis